jgi:hypothetical protein
MQITLREWYFDVLLAETPIDFRQERAPDDEPQW